MRHNSVTVHGGMFFQAMIHHLENAHADGEGEESVRDDAHACKDFDERWEVLGVENLDFARQVGKDDHLPNHVCIPAISNHTDDYE